MKYCYKYIFSLYIVDYKGELFVCTAVLLEINHNYHMQCLNYFQNSCWLLSSYPMVDNIELGNDAVT